MAAAGAVLFLGLSGAPLQAQQPVVIGSGAPNVYVNTQVLDSLGPGYAPAFGGYNYGVGYGAAPFPQAAAPASQQAGVPFMVSRPGTLLFPPPELPRSQVTVRLPGVAFNQDAWPAPAAAAPMTTPPDFSKPAQAELASRVIAPAETSLDAAPPAPEPMPAEPEVAAPELPAEPAPQTAAALASESVVAPPPPAIEETSEAAPPPPAPGLQNETQDAPAMVDASTAPAQAPTTGTSGNLSVPEPAAPPEPALAEAEAELAAPPPPELPPEPETIAPAAPAAASTEPKTETAAIAPVDLGDDSIRLMFDEGSAELTDDAKRTLLGLAEGLSSDGNARVQLLAYAGSADKSASRARRLSLSRALAVRAFLIDQGVRSTRMDVRALGNKSEGGPADRVDIMPANR